MSAIITENFRRTVANMLLGDVKGGTNNYYIGIGQADDWDDAILAGAAAPYPVGTYTDETRVKDHLTGLFKVTGENASIMIPKVTAEAGVKYKVYDPLDPTCFYEDYENDLKPCFAVTSPNHIFICIRKDGDTALTDATGLGANLADFGMIVIGDYTWAYIGRYDLYNDLNTSGFVAVSDDTSPSPLADSVPAKALITGPNPNSSLVITADETLLPGDAGNYYEVSMQSSTASPEAFSIGSTGAGGITYVTFEYPTSTTADGLKNYINGVTGFELDASLPLNQPNGSGLVGATGSIRLEGGGVSETVAKNETGGLVYGFKVINGGSGYTDPSTPAPTGSVTYTINDAELIGVSETGFERTATVAVSVTIDHDTNGGTVTAIDRVVSTVEELKTAKDFLEAKLTFPSPAPAGVSFPDNAEDEAVVIPYIAPIGGFGSNKFETLPTWYVGLFGDTALADYVPNLTEYRQVSLIRNPLDAGDTLLTKTFASTLPYIEFYAADDPDELAPDPSADLSGAAPGDRIIQNGKDCGRLEYIQTEEISGGDRIALSPYRYYYSTDHKYGYAPLDLINPISFTPENGDPVVPLTPFAPTAIVAAADYSPDSGTLVFQDNRSGITREEGQNEELKIIIQA